MQCPVLVRNPSPGDTKSCSCCWCRFRHERHGARQKRLCAGSLWLWDSTATARPVWKGKGAPQFLNPAPHERETHLFFRFSDRALQGVSCWNRGPGNTGCMASPHLQPLNTEGMGRGDSSERAVPTLSSEGGLKQREESRVRGTQPPVMCFLTTLTPCHAPLPEQMGFSNNWMGPSAEGHPSTADPGPRAPVPLATCAVMSVIVLVTCTASRTSVPVPFAILVASHPKSSQSHLQS